MRDYSLRVRRIAVLATLLAGLSACAASSPPTSPTRISFGISGGNIAPYKVTIEPRGLILASSSLRPRQHRLSRSEVASLSRLVRKEFANGVQSRQCRGANPDIASDFIRAYGRTVTVHGGCEPRFQQLRNTLAQAVGLDASRA